MRIHGYGTVISCRNITFEDNKFDMNLVHPGIVLLPTSEKDEYAYCLYMTSDRKRASREKNKYIKNPGKTEKQSYINLQQIIKRPNIKDMELSQLSDEDFEEVLEKFYNYQIGLNPQKQEFLEIKSKVKTMLDILKFNKEFNIDRSVSRKELDMLDSVMDKKKKMIYCAHTLTLETNSTDGQIIENRNNFENLVKTYILPTEKDRRYFETLMSTYNKIKDIDFDKLNFNNPNNEIRQLYIDLRIKNYLINVNVLFNDIADMFTISSTGRENKAQLINSFVEFEQSREAAKVAAREEKRRKKEMKKKQIAKNTLKEREQEKRKHLISKYGNFDIDFFDN